MNGFTFVEKLVLSVTLLVVTLLTFGNVLSRYVLPTSWSFTEELTINVFVLLSLLGAAVCARQEGGLVSMAVSANKYIFLIIINIIFLIAGCFVDANMLSSVSSFYFSETGRAG